MGDTEMVKSIILYGTLVSDFPTLAHPTLVGKHLSGTYADWIALRESDIVK